MNIKHNLSCALNSRIREILVIIISILGTQLSICHAGILSTPHNLTADGNGPGEEYDNKALCIFCHTPQGKAGASLEWNKTNTERKPFRTFDSFGRSGITDSGSVGSVSIACLSCHDGIQASNNITRIGGSSAAQSDIVRPANSAPGEVDGSPFAIDVSKSHPVGVRYGGSIQSGTNNPEFNPLVSDILDDVTVWWVETGGTGRQRSDLRLYTRIEGDSKTVYVECATCHDPHSENRLFLRNSNTGSMLCLSCHIK